MSWLIALFLVLVAAAPVRAADTIKLGFNIPLTGDIPDVGESSKNAAEMLKKKINDAGGITVGGKKYLVEFVYEDNESKAESALSAAGTVWDRVRGFFRRLGGTGGLARRARAQQRGRRSHGSARSRPSSCEREPGRCRPATCISTR